MQYNSIDKEQNGFNFGSNLIVICLNRKRYLPNYKIEFKRRLQFQRQEMKLEIYFVSAREDWNNFNFSSEDKRVEQNKKMKSEK